MNRRTPPALAGLLLRILPLGERRPEVEADLLELFAVRARYHGERYASRRYYGDVLSLWRRSGMRTDHLSPAPVRANVLGEIAQVIRTNDSPEGLIPSVRSALHPIDPRVRLDITPVSDGLQRQLAEPRSLAVLAGALAALALALAVVGLYGVTAFVVGQRTQEISVRVALGASGRDIMRLLAVDSLRPVMVGLAAGVFAALLGSRLFSGVLYGVRSADPVAFVAAVMVLFSAAVAAVMVPTRRAARVDPASVLRQL